jgi:spore maturation protein CgeB
MSARGSRRIVVLGLSLSSSWGNGHATTYRALLKALAERGHRILFLERDRPWYAAHRDVKRPRYCRLELYRSVAELSLWREEIAAADVVIVGSYVPDGVEVARFVQGCAQGITAFYDIDTPVTLAKLQSGDHEYLTPALISGFGLYLSFTGGPTLDLLERRYRATAARALYCSVDPALYRPVNARQRWDIGYLGTYSRDRQVKLEKLLFEPARRRPELRFVVAGAQYPRNIDWPHNVEHIDHLPPSKHAAFYSSLGWALNLTRDDMVDLGYSPSVRIFEAAACGTPIISDFWRGLDQILSPGKEVAIAQGPASVVKLLARPEGYRRAIGRAGRSRVLASHTAADRAEELEEYLAEASRRLLARSASSPQERIRLRAGALAALRTV